MHSGFVLKPVGASGLASLLDGQSASLDPRKNARLDNLTHFGLSTA